MISSDNRFADGKALFMQVISPLPSDVQNALCRVLFSPRFQINWDQLYYELLAELPESREDTISLDAVEQALIQIADGDGFIDYAIECGHSIDDRLGFNEAVNLLSDCLASYDPDGEYDYDQLADEIVRAAFKLGR